MSAGDAPPLEIVLGSGPPAGWDDLVARDPASRFFHLPLWTRLYASRHAGAAPLWIAARREGRLVGGLPAVSLRRGPVRTVACSAEGTPCGPLTEPDLDPAERSRVGAAVLAALADARTPVLGAVHLVLDADADGAWRQVLADAGWSRTPSAAALLPLAGGIEHVERHVFRKNRRNERNRALRRGCEPSVTDDPQAVAAYYPVYRAAAARWGVAPAPEGFLRDLLAQGEGRVFLSRVRLGDEVIGGHLCFHHGDRVVAWNGATRPEHAERFPATLLIWTDLEEACRREAAWLDLGGSGGVGGVANFKRLLGALEVERGAWRRASPWFDLLRRLRGRAGRRSDAR